MADFLQSLRAQGIFNPQGGGGNLLGPPNFAGTAGDGGNIGDIMGTIMHLREQAKMADQRRAMEMMDYQNNMQNRNEAKKAAEIHRNLLTTGSTTGYMQEAPVRWPDEEQKYKITPYQQGMLDNSRAAIEQRAAAATGRDTNADEDRIIRQQRANVYDRTHDLSDAEKLDLTIKARSGDIQARGALAAELEKERQQGRTALADINNKTDKEIEQMREKAAGERNTATIAGRSRDTDVRVGAQSKTALLPSQERVKIGNAAREFKNSNSNLGQYVNFDSAGNPIIDPPGYGGPSEEDYRQIYNGIYGSRTTDIQLPPSNPTTPIPGYQGGYSPTPVQPPLTSVPTPPKSRFKVTVE